MHSVIYLVEKATAIAKDISYIALFKPTIRNSLLLTNMHNGIVKVPVSIVRIVSLRNMGFFVLKSERYCMRTGSVDEVDSVVATSPKHRCNNLMYDACFPSA